MNLRPLNANLAVRPLDPPKKKGSLFLPDATVDKPTRGIVIAIGPGRYSMETGMRLPPSVKVGDEVLYRWGSDPVDLGGDIGEVLLMHEDNLFAVVDGGKQ